MAQTVKHPSAMQETQVQSLGWKDPLEKGMTTPSSSILAWRIPWSLASYSPWGHKESDMTEWLTHTYLVNFQSDSVCHQMGRWALSECEAILRIFRTTLQEAISLRSIQLFLAFLRRINSEPIRSCLRTFLWPLFLPSFFFEGNKMLFLLRCGCHLSS